MEKFRLELEKLINRYSIENGSNTPDFILAEYLQRCIENFDITLQQREKWYGRTVNKKAIVRQPIFIREDRDEPESTKDELS